MTCRRLRSSSSNKGSRWRLRLEHDTFSEKRIPARTTAASHVGGGEEKYTVKSVKISQINTSLLGEEESAVVLRENVWSEVIEGSLCIWNGNLPLCARLIFGPHGLWPIKHVRSEDWSIRSYG